MTSTNRLDIDGVGLTLAHVAAVSRREVSAIRLTDVAMGRVARSRDQADATARVRLVYGRSTGVGANRGVAITGDPVEHPLMLLRSHASAAGEARSPERVRAMLLVRLNQLAAGGSGVRPAVLEALRQMIEADALPDVRELGSIGTGDLSALATTALALMGEAPTSHPLSAPMTFGSADGLAFLSSNAATLGDAALAVDSLVVSTRAALVVAALTFHAVDGNAEAYSALVERVTPFAGAIASSAFLRLLTGSDRTGVRRDTAGRVLPAARIQDPFGLRTVPQVHGPVLDQVKVAGDVITALINGPGENPLMLADVTAGGGTVAHHGGFHYAYLQMAMDSLALAVAQSCTLVLARLAMLIEPYFTGLAPFLGDGSPGASGVMVCEYVAASALGSIRAAATPAGLQSVVLSRGVEENASFASLAATNCLEISVRYRQLLACELVAAVRANRMRIDRPMAGMVGEALALCAILPTAMADRDLSGDLAAAAALLPALAGLLPLVYDNSGSSADHVVKGA